MFKRMSSLLLIASVTGCNVDSTDKSTGGVDAQATAKCPAGIVAVLSDYVSSQLAVLDPAGEVLSGAFLSSGSTLASGVAAPFSGDLGLPSAATVSGEVVVIDRFGTNVLTWVDPKTAQVRAQLPVGTGFESNPQDYLELSRTKAYVARFGDNASPGKEAFDQGGDILVVDPTGPSIVSSIALPRASSFPPAPVSITLRGTTAIVVLQRFDSVNYTQGESELLGIDTTTDAVSWDLRLQGKKSCGRAELSPSGKLLAISCSGTLNADGLLADPKEAGILLYDATVEPPSFNTAIPVDSNLGFPAQGEIAFASEGVLLAKTQTPWGGVGNNKLFTLDLETEITTVLSEARPDADGKGKGVTYTGIKCMPGCNNLCLLGDADLAQIRRFDIQANFAELPAIDVGAPVGFPPRGFGPL